MISEFERYHGVALRAIIVKAPGPVVIEKYDLAGRTNSYLINDTIAVHIKHSAKRLSPWAFSFTIDQLREFVDLRKRTESIWLLLVCGIDGLVSLSLEEFVRITGSRPGGVAGIRVERCRREMCRIFGNEAEIR